MWSDLPSLDPRVTLTTHPALLFPQLFYFLHLVCLNLFFRMLPDFLLIRNFLPLVHHISFHFPSAYILLRRAEIQRTRPPCVQRCKAARLGETKRSPPDHNITALVPPLEFRTWRLKWREAKSLVRMNRQRKRARHQRGCCCHLRTER